MVEMLLYNLCWHAGSTTASSALTNPLASWRGQHHSQTVEMSLLVSQEVRPSGIPGEHEHNTKPAFQQTTSALDSGSSLDNLHCSRKARKWWEEVCVQAGAEEALQPLPAESAAVAAALAGVAAAAVAA
mmetsp:Transcript_68610/g.135730  ORF Transcript_68610/g.135730 Transcript_68610/m.135730 type:complete len:129 (+) Transcript_68610:436-822(+)